MEHQPAQVGGGHEVPFDFLGGSGKAGEGPSNQLSHVGYSIKELELLKGKAIIYKSPKRPYEDAMNAAASELVLSDPHLADDRGTLLIKARERLADRGYNFKKGFSRGKSGPPPEERRKVWEKKWDADSRQTRGAQMSEVITLTHRRIEIKRKLISNAEGATLARLQGELDELLTKERRLLHEKREITSKQYKAQWHKKRNAAKK